MSCIHDAELSLSVDPEKSSQIIPEGGAKEPME